jgi:hypothetical protein
MAGAATINHGDMLTLTAEARTATHQLPSCRSHSRLSRRHQSRASLTEQIRSTGRRRLENEGGQGVIQQVANWPPQTARSVHGVLSWTAGLKYQFGLDWFIVNNEPFSCYSFASPSSAVVFESSQMSSTRMARWRSFLVRVPERPRKSQVGTCTFFWRVAQPRGWATDCGGGGAQRTPGQRAPQRGRPGGVPVGDPN